MGDNVARNPPGIEKFLCGCGKGRRDQDIGVCGQAESVNDRKDASGEKPPGAAQADIGMGRRHAWLTVIEGGKGKGDEAVTGNDEDSVREEKRLPGVIGIPYSSADGVNTGNPEDEPGEKEEAIMKNWAKYILMATVAVLAAFGLSACGGGGGSQNATSAPVVSTGTMTKGSVIVNGVRFTAAAGATVRVDDNPGATEGTVSPGREMRH